jgi:hypothetical protein
MVTAMATCVNSWAVVMSKTNGIADQVGAGGKRSCCVGARRSLGRSKDKGARQAGREEGWEGGRRVTKEGRAGDGAGPRQDEAGAADEGAARRACVPASECPCARKPCSSLFAPPRPAAAPSLAQVVELDFQYPSEGIHKRWEAGYRITCAAATHDQAAFVLSSMRSSNVDETQARAAGGLPRAVATSMAVCSGEHGPARGGGPGVGLPAQSGAALGPQGLARACRVGPRRRRCARAASPRSTSRRSGVSRGGCASCDFWARPQH